MQALDLDEQPPPTASSTASFHSALQSPTKRLTPSPTKFLNGVQQQSQSYQQAQLQPTVTYIEDISYQVPIRRRSLLQAAAPGTATRPKVNHEPKPSQDSMIDDEVLVFTPPSRLLALDLAGTRPETPQDQEALGGFRKGSLFVTNGAPSPAPSSPSLRATSGGSQRMRDSSLLSLPPLPAVDTSYPAAKPEEPTTAIPETPKTEGFAIPRKPVGSSDTPSPPSARKPAVQIDTTSPPPHLGLRLVPPSPDEPTPNLGESSNVEPVSPVSVNESIDEDPHRRHLFGYSQRNKQFMNGQFQPSPSSDYSQTTSGEPSTKPGLSRSPFSYEGSRLLHTTSQDVVEVEDAGRNSIAIEPTKGYVGLDTPGLEEVKPKPLVVRKSLKGKEPVVAAESSPQEQQSTDYLQAISATEDKLTAGSVTSETSDQSQAKQSAADSGYSSAGSSVLPPSNNWEKSKNRQSAPEHIVNSFNQAYPEARPATSHNSKADNITTSVLTIPYSSVRNRTPPALEAPPKTPKTKKEKQLMAAAMRKSMDGNEGVEVDEAAQKKAKKKRRLSFKRLSFKSEKKVVIEPKEIENTDYPIDAVEDLPKSSPGFLPPLNLDGPEETQYQLQPQPERRQSLTSSIRSGLQSIGYAPEAAALQSPSDEGFPYEPMAITSSTSSRGVQAVRSSETVSYTGAAYYQRFSTPSPGPGNISSMAAQNTQSGTPERHPSLPRHTTPPSSYKPPNRYSMEESRPNRQDQQQMQIRRRPLGNSTIKSPQSPTYSNFNHSGGSMRVSRNNSFNSSYSYNTQSGLYQSNQFNNSRGSHARYNSQPNSPAYNGVLPFATSSPPDQQIQQQQPVQRQRSGSTGSVGPAGYPHLGQDYTTDQAMFGLDFSDIPVRRANDLVQSYGSPAGGYYTRRPSGEMFYVPDVNPGPISDEGRKKESFWRRAKEGEK
ncbi:hypothetical protein ABW19_dt0202857 [Dactylella cylindrospora]|nr:hypothetical protein ABW19_dt0202857 [Dactylella cylindrospora]